MRDGLTGPSNHVTFQERLREELVRVTRHGRPTALMMADIDDFKAVNDTYGHQVGDQLLRQITEIIRSPQGRRHSGEIRRRGICHYHTRDHAGRGRAGGRRSALRRQAGRQEYGVDGYVRLTMLTVLALAFAVVCLTVAWVQTRELQRITKRLHALYRVSRFIVSTLDPEEVAAQVVRATREIMGYSHVAVFRVRDDTLVPMAWAGYAQPLPELPVSTGITGRVVRTGKPAFVPNVARDPDFVAGTDATTSEIAYPIIVEEKIVGVFNVETVGGRRLTDEDVQLIGNLAAQLSLAYRNALQHEEVRERARRDGLTNLLDQAAFLQQLDLAVARAQQNGTLVAVAIGDLDDFRAFNDLYGRVEGDAALRRCADTIRATIRDHDVAARYGGEEFAILLPGATRDGARAAAERIRKRLENAGSRIGDTHMKLTASFGVAAFPDDARGALDLIRRADEALAIAKYAGKNCVREPVVLDTAANRGITFPD